MFLQVEIYPVAVHNSYGFTPQIASRRTVRCDRNTTYQRHLARQLDKAAKPPSQQCHPRGEQGIAEPPLVSAVHRMPRFSAVDGIGRVCAHHPRRRSADHPRCARAQCRQSAMPAAGGDSTWESGERAWGQASTRRETLFLLTSRSTPLFDPPSPASSSRHHGMQQQPTKQVSGSGGRNAQAPGESIPFADSGALAAYSSTSPIHEGITLYQPMVHIGMGDLTKMEGSPTMDDDGGMLYDERGVTLGNV
ncbi:hypothetical protein C8R44DRAFT_882821 [Mycena epipterygia]|nr:hypothetical protein C8R44DRAFT_882821 [Mycena epipterygia]